MRQRLAVVTGASGLLGASVLRHLQGRSERVLGWSRQTPALPGGSDLQRVDLLADGPGLLRRLAPDLVVHCAAATDVDGCEREPDLADAVNAVAPGRLAEAARSTGCRFVHVSTDAVYDGEAPGAHHEDEVPAPLSEYARTKLRGERAVLTACPDALVVRTTMHGWGPPGRRSFSEAVLGGLVRGRPVLLFGDVSFSPLVVTDLARDLADLAGTGASGVVNAGSRDGVTKERFGRLVARAFDLPEDLVRRTALAERRLLAPRPRNTVLDASRCERLLGRRSPSVADGLARLHEQAVDGWAASLKGRPPGRWQELVEDGPT